MNLFYELLGFVALPILEKLIFIILFIIIIIIIVITTIIEQDRRREKLGSSAWRRT